MSAAETADVVSGPAGTGSDVFVSYSRADREFAVRLTEGLRARGREAWVDWQDIPPTAEWMAEIQEAIDAADTVVVVLSPDLIRSTVCSQEIEHALEANKRIVPLLYREVDAASVPVEIAKRNWLLFGDEDGFEQALDQLVGVLDTDLEQVKFHTGMLVKAREWDTAGRPGSRLLRGSDLAAAERWLGEPGRGVEPTALQRQYVLASRQAASRRQRLLVATAVVALAIVAVLGVLALLQRNDARDQRQTAIEQRGIAEEQRQVAEEQRAEADTQRQQAVEQRDLARSAALASAALAQLDVDPELSLLLSSEAADLKRTDLVERALRESIKASNVELVYRDPAGTDSLGRGVDHVAFAPDGSWVASLSNEGVRMWDPRTGETLRTILPTLEPGTEPQGLAVDPSGQRLAVVGHSAPTAGGTHGGTILLADPASGRIVRSIFVPTSSYLGPLEFDATGSHLLAVTNAGVVLYDAASGEKQRTIKVPPFNDLIGGLLTAAFSPDGTVIAGALLEGPVQLWDTATGDSIGTLEGHVGPVDAVAFSPDGARVVTAGDDRTARVWDLASRRQLLLLPHLADVKAALFTRDGAHVVTADAEGVGRVWSLEAAQPISILRGHDRAITSLALSPDGDRLVTGSQDGTARIWRLGAAVNALYADQGALTWGAALTPDGAVIAVGSQTGAQLLDAASGLLVRRLGKPGGHFGAPAVSPDGSLIAACCLGTPSRGYEFSQQGMRNLDPDARSAVAVWSTRTGALVSRLELPPGAEAASSVAFSPDGSRLVATGYGAPAGAPDFVDPIEARVFDIATGQVVAQLRGAENCIGMYISALETICGSAFAPDGRTVASGDGQKVVLWDSASGDVKRRLVPADGLDPTIYAQVAGISFSSDGTLLAASAGDAGVRIFDTATGREIHHFAGDQAQVTQVAFSPDGRVVAAGGGDGTVRVYSLDGTELQQYRAAKLLVTDIDWSPDGSSLVVTTAEGWEGWGGTDGSSPSKPTGAVRVYRCDVCRDFDGLVTLARERATRELTPEERETYLAGV